MALLIRQFDCMYEKRQIFAFWSRKFVWKKSTLKSFLKKQYNPNVFQNKFYIKIKTLHNDNLSKSTRTSCYQ